MFFAASIGNAAAVDDGGFALLNASRKKWEEGCAQGEDFRTVLSDLLAKRTLVDNFAGLGS
jgi:hypothetical protein